MYAFLQPHPLPGFEELVNGFLTVCDGLPLSLKVFGASLYEENDKSHWQEQLKRLEKTLPQDIEKSLRISYDSLSVEQMAFLLFHRRRQRYSNANMGFGRASKSTKQMSIGGIQ